LQHQASLSGQLALVTGASSGIGRAIAIDLARQGATVMATGRQLKRLNELREQAPPGSIVPLALDVCDNDQVDALPRQLPKNHEAVDILVNNAAQDIGGRTRFDQSDPDELSLVIQTNLIGLMRVTRAVVPAMLQRGRGTIVNIGSTNALRPTPTMAAYTASKAGVHALTDALRADFAKEGLRVIEVVPGLTRTEFAQTRMRGDSEKARAFFEKFPGALEPQDVADAVVYAVTRPAHVCIQQIVVTPWFQW
jgi:NADP-dependent 3-hydroxy acid dehydrogenase YdfG